MTWNVNGARRKPKLDPVRMEAIKEAVFQLEPSTRADRILAWNASVRDIDTMNRRLGRYTKENKKLICRLHGGAYSVKTRVLGWDGVGAYTLITRVLK